MGDVKKQPKATGNVVVHMKDARRGGRGESDGMSPSMRQLILSFGRDEGDVSWNPDAFSRRPTAEAS